MSSDLYDAIRSMQRLARVLKVDDSGAQQLVNLHGAYGDKPRNVWRTQDYGFSSNPPAGSEGILHALAGNSDRLIFRDGGHQDHRPKAAPSGTTVIYDDKGNIVFVKGANGIEIRARAGKVTVTPAPGDFVYLGGNGVGGGYGQVVTTLGPSPNVFAKV